MSDPELAAGIIGFILGCGTTIIFAMIIRCIFRAISHKRKVPYKSQYFMMDHDGNKIPMDEDDGEI